MATRAPKPPANWTPANSIDTSTCKSIQCSVTYQWHHNKAKQTITNKPPLAYTVRTCAIYALRHLHLHLPQIQRNISCCHLKSSYHLQSSMSDIKGSQVPCLIHNSLKKTRFKAPGIHEKCGGSMSLPTFYLGILTTPAPWKTAGPEALGIVWRWGRRGWQSGNHICCWDRDSICLYIGQEEFHHASVELTSKKGVKRNMLSSNAWCSNAFCSLGQWEVDPKRDIQINLGNSTRHKPIIHLTKAKECYVCFWALRLFSCHVGSHTLNSNRS